MSNLTVKGNASGTGTVILEAPNTNSNRTITLPDSTSTLATTADVAAVVTGPTLGTAVASTSGTAIDFTGIPSTAKRITLMFDGVSFAASPGGFGIRLGTSSGVDTTSDYNSWLTTLLNATSPTVAQDLNNNAMYMHSGTSHTNSTTTSGAVVLVNLTGNRWIASGTICCSSPVQQYQFLGVKALSSTLDRVRLFCFTSNFDAGTINISWE